MVPRPADAPTCLLNTGLPTQRTGYTTLYSQPHWSIYYHQNTVWLCIANIKMALSVDIWVVVYVSWVIAATFPIVFLIYNALFHPPILNWFTYYRQNTVWICIGNIFFMYEWWFILVRSAIITFPELQRTRCRLDPSSLYTPILHWFIYYRQKKPVWICIENICFYCMSDNLS